MIPRVAVITPSYNDEAYIEHAIVSVMNQTLTNVCHYIYSDASTDNSVSIIKNYQTKYQQCHVIGQQNLGQAHGRNVLIDQARRDGCEIVAFLDSDDRWHPNHLADNIKYLEDHDVVYHDPEYQFDNGARAFPHGFILPHIAIPKNFFYRNFIFVSTALVRISALTNVYFDNELNSIEDWDLWCQLYVKQKRFVKNIEQPTAIYIIKQQNSSSQGPKKISTIKQKYPLLDQLKLNIGYYTDYQKDCINISPMSDCQTDCVFELDQLPYDHNTVDSIRVRDCIEKLGYHESATALKNWYDVLRPGGKLLLTTVDFESCCRQFINSNEQEQINLYRLFFGEPYNSAVNKFLFTEKQLLMHLSWCNFSQIKRIPDQPNYITIEAVK